MKRLSERYVPDPKALPQNAGRTLVCQLNWIRDHIHQSKGGAKGQDTNKGHDSEAQCHSERVGGLLQQRVSQSSVLKGQ